MRFSAFAFVGGLMKHFSGIAATLIGLGAFALAESASATVFNYTVYPSDVAPAGTAGALFSGDGSYNTAFAGPVTADPTSGAPGWGTSSFVSNITGLNSTTNVNGTYKYSEFQLPNLDALFHTSVPLTVGDLASISYETKNNSGTSQDWDVRIYTVKANSSDPGFYQSRIESPNPVAGNTNWNNWDLNSNAKTVDVVNRALGTTTDTSSASSLTPGGATLSQLSSVYHYGSQTILYMSFLAGASGNGSPISTNLDGIQITLTNGDVANINLAATPEPASVVMIGLGAIGLLLVARRHRKA